MVFRSMVARISPTFAVRLPVLSRILVVVHLGNDARFYQLLHAVEISVCKVVLRLGRSQLSSLLSGVELHEHVARLDRCPGFEVDLLHDAGQIRAHGDAAHGNHTSNCVESHGPVLLPSDNGGYRLRRRLESRVCRNCRFDLPKLHKAEARDEHCRHEQHQEHPFRHSPYLNETDPHKALLIRFAKGGKRFSTSPLVLHFFGQFVELTSRIGLPAQQKPE